MTISLNLRTGLILMAALAVLVVGITIVVAQIVQRAVPGSYIIGNVQTSEETILLFSEAPPSTADLPELEFGTGDIDAFGFFITPPRVHFWAANGGQVPFFLILATRNVVITRGGSPVASSECLVTIPSAPYPRMYPPM